MAAPIPAEDPAVWFAQRFIGAETLPSRMSELDVHQFFSLSKDDVSAVCERFRDDLWSAKIPVVVSPVDGWLGPSTVAR
ncbi:hypothetical protein [Variovorax sp. J22R115]|uniref:hypothetical protein n=1 Tax=Variovorax sp. J22R115 TaxID=3053509 RepID=UPI0025789985|nr:hypothetical protein [Variovorax sp. J22R115]MDM0053525.1 hypothetical protein [Variovorax sp. J22R115]